MILSSKGLTVNIIIGFLSLCVILLFFTRKNHCILGHLSRPAQKSPGGFQSMRLLGIRFRADKVYEHNYDSMYERYLTEYRGKNITILEIGLGCGMPLGEGASANLWRAYFGPEARIHVIEIDKSCGEKWFQKEGYKLDITMHYGSQSDPVFLQTVITLVRQFDIIIDDGGHSMSQQIISLRALLPAVRENGLYVIEDLLTSYERIYGGGPVGQVNTTVAILKQLIDDVQLATVSKWNPELSRYIYSFEVGPHIVFFRRKKW